MRVIEENNKPDNYKIIGNSSKTVDFSVLDESTAMYIMSTGLYSNPLKAMIREILFNAWDAHKENNCTDKPIDIYLNVNNQLIIRDYGLGIPSEDMHSIYCVYGASTKKDDESATGGFGLGCKSPFAYTDNFTVISYNNNIKDVYYISKVSENSNGNPGISKLSSSTTEETGLTVNIPLLVKDKETVLTYIKDIMFLSGIKLNLHTLDKDGNNIIDKYENNIVKKYFYSKGNVKHYREVDNIFLVLGGVKYKLEEKYNKEYYEEYKKISKIVNKGKLFINVEPNSITPLPSREGIRYTPNTIKTIKKYLNEFIDNFTEGFKSYTDICVRVIAKKSVQNKDKAIKVLFNVNHYWHMEKHNSIYCDEDIYKEFLNNSNDIDISLYTNYAQEYSYKDLISLRKFKSIIVNNLIKYYPNDSKLIFKYYNNEYKEPKDFFINYIGNIIFDLYKFELSLKKESIKFTSYVFEKLSYRTNYSYNKIDRDIHIKKPYLTKNKKSILYRKRNPYLYKFNYTNLLNNSFIGIIDKNIYTFNFSFNTNYLDSVFNKKILLSKNVKDMKNTDLEIDSDLSAIFCYTVSSERNYRNAYEKLKNAGYTVIEATPVERVKLKNNKKIPTQYIKLTPKYYDSLNLKDAITAEKNPTHYFYYNKGVKNSYYSYGTSLSLIKDLLKIYPNTIVCTTKSQKESLEKKGLISLEKGIFNWFNKLKKNNNKNYVNILKYIYVLRNTNININILKTDGFNKILNVRKIKLSEQYQFWLNISTINNIMCSHNISSIFTDIGKEVDEDFIKEKVNENLNKVVTYLSMFSTYKISSSYFESNKEYDIFIKNFIKFIQSMKKDNK